MQRPVMDPTYREASESSQGGRCRQWPSRAIGRLFILELCGWRQGHSPGALEAGLPARIARSIRHWLLFLPPALLLVSGGLVYYQTHARAMPLGQLPPGLAIYHEPVALLGEDGVRLNAWLFPVLNATRVLEYQEGVLHEKLPAAILIRDPSDPHPSLLELIRPLHASGMVVLLLEVRAGAHGRTFGLREALDVESAIALLRRRSFVDPDRIALVGHGAGASAALIAATRDPRIAALSLDTPPHTPQQVLDRLAPPTMPLGALQPICRWLFEIGYGVDLDDLDPRHHAQTLRERPTLLFASWDPGAGSTPNPPRTRRIVAFLTHHLSG